MRPQTSRTARGCQAVLELQRFERRIVDRAGRPQTRPLLKAANRLLASPAVDAVGDDVDVQPVAGPGERELDQAHIKAADDRLA
jgi:hypothetical protein